MRHATRLVRLTVALLVILTVAAPTWAAPKKDPARAITDGIICPCSCGEILTGCTCDTGMAMKAYVDREVGGGKSKDQVEAALVSQYGEVILGAPKAQGFNLVVWIAPFVMTVVGFLFASHVLVKWSRRREALVVEGGSSAPGSESRVPEAARLAALRARAEEELKGLRE